MVGTATMKSTRCAQISRRNSAASIAASAPGAVASTWRSRRARRLAARRGDRARPERRRDQGQDVVVDPAVHPHDGVLALPPAGGIDAGRHLHAVHGLGVRRLSGEERVAVQDAVRPRRGQQVLHPAGRSGPLRPQLNNIGGRRLQPRRGGLRHPRRALRNGDRVLGERPNEESISSTKRAKLAGPIGAGRARTRSTSIRPPASSRAVRSCSARATSPTTRQ